MSTHSKLEEMKIGELEEAAADLRHMIARSHRDTRMEEIELKKVEAWIALRQKEALEGSTSDS